MNGVLLLKLVLTPLLIAGVSLAGRRWGPMVSGWLVGLPLTSAPVVLFLALEQGTDFATQAAVGILLGLISTAMFCLVYSRLAPHTPWPGSLLGSWAAVVAVPLGLRGVQLPLWPAAALVVGGLIGVRWAIPVTPAAIAEALPLPRWDIPARMVLATAFVLALTAGAAALGPQLSGLIAPLPIYATILAVFTHRLQGVPATQRLLRALVTGVFSTVLFYLALALLLQPTGLLMAFGGATSAALGLHALSLTLMRRGPAGS